MALREVLAHFGIDVDDAKLEAATKKLENFAEALGGLEILRRMDEFTREQVEIGEQLGINAQRLGVTTEELQRLSLAAGEVPTEALTAGLRFLNRNIGEAARGGSEAAQAFSQLGVSIREGGKLRSTSDVLGDVAEKIEAMGDASRQTDAAMRLFGRGGSELLPLLQEGRKGLDSANDAFKRLGGAVDEDFVRKAREAGRASRELNFALTGLKSQIAVALFPAFTRTQRFLGNVVAGFREWAEKTTLLQTALPALKLGTMAATLYKIVTLLKSLGFTFTQLAMAGAKFGAIASAAAALYLIFDDLFALMHGGASVIGTLLDKLFGAGTAAKFARELTKAWEAVSDALSGILKGKYPEWLQTVIEFGSDAIDIVKGLGDALMGVGVALFDISQGRFGDAVADAREQFDGIGAAIDRIKGRWDAGQARVTAATMAPFIAESNREDTGFPDLDAGGNGALMPALASGYAPGLPTHTPRNRNGEGPSAHGAERPVDGSTTTIAPVYNITNNITGASDPKETAKRVSDGMQSAVQHAENMRSTLGAIRSGT